MRVRRLIYLSNANEPFAVESLHELRENARHYNARQGVTGVLLYGDSRFIQFVEGKTAGVHAVMKRIEADDRHRMNAVVYDREDSKRLFVGWDFAYEHGTPSLPADVFADWIKTHLIRQVTDEEDLRAVQLLYNFCEDLVSSRKALIVLAV
jgi:hypothetical protein